MIYYFTFLVSIIISYCCEYKISGWKSIEIKLPVLNKIIDIKSIIIAVSIFIFPILLATFRVGVGTDYKNYALIYEQINHYSLVPTEIGFYLINKIAFLLGNFRWVLFISECIICFTTYYGLRKLKKDISITAALPVFYFLMYATGFNIIRQMIAIGIMTIAYANLINGKKINFIISVVIASFFHSTAILFIVFLLYDILRKKFGNYIFWIFLGFIIIFCLFSSNFITLVGNLLGYGDSGRYNVQNMKIGSSIVLFTLLIPLFISKFFVKEKKFDTMYELMLTNVVFIFITFYQEWGFRFCFYLYPIFMILTGLTIKKMKREIKLKSAFVLFYLYGWYFSYFTLYIIILGHEGAYPYYSIFS